MTALRVLVWLIPFTFIAYSLLTVRRDPYGATLAFVGGVGLLAVCIVQVTT